MYFSIPNDYLTTYGDIAGIYATWDERRTQPMLVIGDVRYENGEWTDFGKAYQEFKGRIGQDISKIYDDDKGWASSQVNYSFAAGMYSTKSIDPWLSLISWVFELADYLEYINNFTCAACYNMQTKWVDPQPTRLSTLYNVFDVAGDVTDYTIPGSKIIEWWKEYTANNPSSDTICGYASELFTDRVNLKKDLGRVAGRQEMYIPADGDIKLESHTLDRGFWSIFWGTEGKWTSNSYSTQKAIEVMKDGSGYNYDSILKYNESSARSFCQENLMDYSTFSDFQETVQTAKNKNESVVMFRFAQTEYNSLPVSLYKYSSSHNWLNYMKDSDGNLCNAYLSTENVFLDFDILSMTFCKDGVYRTIPVVADPIDAVGGLTAPPSIIRGDGCGGALFTILMCIALVIFIVLLAKVIGWFVRTFKKSNSTNVTINMSDYQKDKDDKKKK